MSKRIVQHNKAFKRALRWDGGAESKQEKCPMAYYELGRSIHPIQDDCGHGPATPCEHLYFDNDPRIDDLSVDIFGTGSHPCSDWTVNYTVDPGGWVPADPGRAWIGELCGCDQKTTRVFKWTTGWKRFFKTRQDTLDVLKKYLDQAKCCFVRK
jgi:hypothetical protein